LNKADTSAVISSGRYSVLLKILGSWQVVLEKTINTKGEGQNHPPCIFARYFSLPFMNFDVSADAGEIVFTYRNGFLVDRLRKREGKEEWLGEIYVDGEFIRHFILRRKI